jgi:hypothetical protein
MSGTVGPCYIGTCGTDVVVSDAAVVDEVTGRLCVLYDGVLCPRWVCGDYALALSEHGTVACVDNLLYEHTLSCPYGIV